MARVCDVMTVLLRVVSSQSSVVWAEGEGDVTDGILILRQGRRVDAEVAVAVHISALGTHKDESIRFGPKTGLEHISYFYKYENVSLLK